MSLSISEDKLIELLKSSGSAYSVSTSDLPTVVITEEPAYPMNYAASGVVYAAPQLVTPEAREALIEARRKIEVSGVKLKSADELSAEIGEMRRVR